MLDNLFNNRVIYTHNHNFYERIRKMIKKILMSSVIATVMVSSAYADTVVVVEKPAPVQTVVVQESTPVVDTTGAIIAGTTAAVVGAVLTHGHGHGKSGPIAPAPAPKPHPAPAPKGPGRR